MSCEQIMITQIGARDRSALTRSLYSSNTTAVCHPPTPLRKRRSGRLPSSRSALFITVRIFFYMQFSRCDPVLFFFLSRCDKKRFWRPPALPYRLQHSTIGRTGLNHRVRDGNGCVPRAHRHQKYSVVIDNLTAKQPLLFLSLERR